MHALSNARRVQQCMTTISSTVVHQPQFQKRWNSNKTHIYMHRSPKAPRAQLPHSPDMRTLYTRSPSKRPSQRPPDRITSLSSPPLARSRTRCLPLCEICTGHGSQIPFTLTDNGRHPKTMRVRGGKCHEMSKTWVLAGSWHEISDLSHCLKQRIPNTRQVSNWASHAVLFASRKNLARYNKKIAESPAAFEHRRILPRHTLRPSRITACGSLAVVHIGRHSDMPGKPRCKGSIVLISR